MSMKKGFLALFLMVTLLCLLLPSPVFADDTGEGILLILLGIILIGGVVFAVAAAAGGGFWDNTFDTDLGEMIIDVQGTSIQPSGFSPVQTLSPYRGIPVEYNIDWLLTERREGHLWAAAGITFESFPGLPLFDIDGSSSGKNLMFGYSDGPWHQKWLFTYFPEDDNIKANVEIFYEF